jgi:hypothetical protein
LIWKECLQGKAPGPTDLGVDVGRHRLYDARTPDDLAGEAELLGRRPATTTQV